MGRWLARFAAVACAATLGVVGAGSAQHAGAATVTVPSADIEEPDQAHGPLVARTRYVGVLSGEDEADWLHYWHLPGRRGMAFESSCPTRVEIWSSFDDALIENTLLDAVDVPGGPRQVYHQLKTRQATVRLNLIRIARTDTASEPCDWRVEATGPFASAPSRPTVSLAIQKRGGRAVAVRVRARFQPSGHVRRGFLDISGVVSRTVRVQVPRSGVVSHRIALPAGKRGAVRVEAWAAASASAAHTDAVVRAVRVSTVAPAPRRRVVKPKRPRQAAVHRFLANPPAMMRGVLRFGKYERGYSLGPTRALRNGWTQICSRGRVLSDRAYPNVPNGEYVTFIFYLHGTKPVVHYVEGHNFVWTRGGGYTQPSGLIGQTGGAVCPSRPS